MKNALISFAVSFTATLLFIAALSAAFTAGATVAQECPTEDSTNCTWHASKHGNGQGQDFITVEVGPFTHTFVNDDREALR